MFLLLCCVAATAMLVSVLFARRLAGGLAAARSAPDWAYAGEPLTIRLRLTNLGPAKYLFSVIDEARVGARRCTAAMRVDVLR
ncbi:MAG: hypothetical protein AAB368_08745, partial [bacterium]